MAQQVTASCPQCGWISPPRQSVWKANTDLRAHVRDMHSRFTADRVQGAFAAGKEWEDWTL